MPVWLELSSRYAITVPTSSRRCAPSAPDVVAEWQHCQFVRHAQEPHHEQLGMSLSCSVPDTDERIGRMSAQIKKAGAGRAPALAGIRNRRWKGAGVASDKKPALEGRRMGSRDLSRRTWRREDRSMLTSGCSRRPL